MKKKLLYESFNHLKSSAPRWQLMLLLLSIFCTTSLLAQSIPVSDFRRLTDVDGTLYFVNLDKELWKSDGTEPGTVKVKDFASISLLANMNGTLYLSADDGTGGSELWKSDGTEEGTVMIKDIRPGSAGSELTSFVAVNGQVYFIANDGATGKEVWKTNGTTGGTQRVKDIMKGVGHSNPSNLTRFNNKLYFVANNGTNGYELWGSDGTEAGTSVVKDIFPGSTSGAPNYVTASGGYLYFAARDPLLGIELWKSDGSESGTVLVKDIREGSIGSYPVGLFDFDGSLFMMANDGIHNFKFWTSNGTPEGTAFIDFPISWHWVHSNFMTVLSGKLYFQSGNPILMTDGTLEGTEEVVSTDFFYTGSKMVELNGALYLFKTSIELWKIEDTGAASLVEDLNSGIYPGDYDIIEFVRSGNNLFFVTWNEDNQKSSVWKSDGTPGGMEKIKEGQNVMTMQRTSLARESSGENKMQALSETTVAHYPNPFVNEFTLRVDGPENASYQASIIHLNGMTAEEHTDMKYNVDHPVGRSLSNGVYLLKVTTKAGMKTKRIVKVD